MKRVHLQSQHPHVKKAMYLCYVVKGRNAKDSVSRSKISEIIFANDTVMEFHYMDNFKIAVIIIKT